MARYYGPASVSALIEIKLETENLKKRVPGPSGVGPGKDPERLGGAGGTTTIPGLKQGLVQNGNDHQELRSTGIEPLHTCVDGSWTP